MADKQAQAMERLTAKLTALRKTLRGEERKILDQMVLGAQSEVTAHRLHMRKITGPDSQRDLRPKAQKGDEVELHQLNVRHADVGAKATAASPRTAAGPDAAKNNQANGRTFLGVTLEYGAYKPAVL